MSDVEHEYMEPVFQVEFRDPKEGPDWRWNSTEYSYQKAVKYIQDRQSYGYDFRIITTFINRPVYPERTAEQIVEKLREVYENSDLSDYSVSVIQSVLRGEF